MKAVAVAGGSPDTPDTPEPEGTEVPATDPGTGDAETPEHADPDEAEKPAPATKSAPNPPADPAAGADLEPAADGDPEADAETAPGPGADADPESGSDVDPEADADTAPDAASEPGADPAADVDPEPATDVDPEADADTPPDAETAPEPGAEGGADADPESGADATPEPEPEPGAEADFGPGAGAVADSGAERASEAEAEDGSEPEPEPGAEAEARPGAHPEPDAEPFDSAKSAPVPGPEAGPEPGTDAEPDTVPGGGAVSEAEAEPGTDAEAEGGGGAGRGGGASDEDADAVERPGGKSRRVPSWARDGEDDAERTSTFVALKDVDAPAKKATWPVAVPQHRTPAPAPAPARATGTAEVVEPTREAPLPPPPALDLLAELTNTPAPPETTRRTAVRRVKIWTPILLALAGAVAGGQLLRPLPEPRIVASDAAYTLDGQFSVPWPAKGQGALRVPGSGDIGAFGEQKPVPTASVAKVMTAYVVLKGHPLRKGDPGPQIEIDAKAVADGASEHESRVEGLVAGTKFSQQDMLKMLMIPSANNVARLLARWDSGTDSEAAFVEKMNAAARELGMTNTTYTDPSGLDAATVSTAADQLKLADAVMKEEAFRAVVALPSAEIKGLSTPLYNNNTLLTVNGLSIRGIKTGSSTPAGGALMWAAYKSVGDETPLILGTLMDQHADGPDPNGENSLKLVLANSKKIIEAVRQALDSAPVIRKGQTVGHVDDGLGGRTPLVATKDLNVIGVPGQRLKRTLRPGASGTPHTAKAGTEVGVLTIGDGEGAKSVPVAVGTALAEPSFGARLSRLR
ncbi:serine hydrolase [Streptomyces goshikiensis]|uniref:serine hydrolase n=1 Tax=Streptomyces goshikiensis TaxID=1942 RepID=UPI003713E075